MRGTYVIALGVLVSSITVSAQNRTNPANLTNQTNPTNPTNPTNLTNPPGTLELSLDEAVRRAIDNNPDLASVRSSTQVEAARVSESESAYTPVFSTIVGATSNSTPPSNFLLGERGVDTSDLFSSTGVRQRLRVGRRDVALLVGHVPHDDRQSADELRSQPAVGIPVRVLAAAAERPQDGSRAAADDRYAAQSGKLGAARQGIGRANDRCREAGVLDVEGHGRQRHGAAALARAGTGAGASEQGARRHRSNASARPAAGRSGGRPAPRKSDSRECGGWRCGRPSAAAHHGSGRHVVLADAPQSERRAGRQRRPA